MRKLKLFFACLLMAVLSIGQVWATETELFSQTYPGSPSGYPNSYTGSYTLTTSGYTLTYANINNGTKAADNWTEVRAGRKNNASVASITTGQIATAVSKVTITFTQVSADLTNELYLEVADNASFTSATKISQTIAQSEVAFTISSPAANQYYRIMIDQKSGSSNGFTRFSGVAFYYNEGGTPTCATPTFSPAAGAVLSGTTVALSTTTEDATIYYTMGANPADPTESDATYSTPIEITTATTIKAIAVKEGSSNSAIATASYTIVEPLTTMQAIFDAATSDATPTYITFSDAWVVTGVSTNGKNVYITDGEKGMILFNNSGNMGLEVGNTLSGTVQRSLKLYGGAAELDGFTTDGLTVGTGDLPAVQELDAAGIEALDAVNTGALIKISGACSVNNSKYYVAGVQLYNALFAFENPTAGHPYEVTGVYVKYNSTKEIMPRSAADIADKVTTYTVTYNNAPGNGTLTIKNGNDVVASGSAVNENTVLTIVTSPDEGYKLKGVTVNDEAYTASTLTLTENVTIAAEFEQNQAPLITSFVLSEIGVETDKKEDGQRVGDKVNLPTTAATCSKTFRGWTTKADFADGDESLESFYAPGAEITLAANNMFYAVYADAHIVTPTDHALGSGTFNGTNEGGNTASEGYTFSKSTKGESKAGYIQDSGTKDETIVFLQIKAESQIISEEPSAIIVTAHLGAGSDKDPLDYPVYAVLVDADGNNVGDPVVLTTAIPKAGDDFSANLPIANYANVRGVKISHMKEDGWNVRYYSMSFKYQTGGTTYDNYSIDCQAQVATPVIAGVSPSGVYTEGKEISITCATDGATIYYAVDSDEEPSTEYTDAFTVDTDGAHTVKAKAVKSGMVASEVASVSFTINLPVVLSTMDAIFEAATEAGGTATDANIAFGNNWVVSGVSTNGKNVYVTDGTKGFIIFDNGGEMGFTVGDVLSGTVACKVQLFKGAAELTNLSASTEGLSIAKEGVITPAVKAISALGGINTGAAVIINSVQFDGTNLTDGANSIKPYNSLFAYDALEDGKYYNVTGIFVQYDATKEILPRSAADIEALVLDDPELSYTPNSVSLEVGQALSAPTFNNPHTLSPISYSVSGDAVATVTNEGSIALVENATGTAVITASFAGNAQYAAGNATFTITVSEPVDAKNVVIIAEYDNKFYAMSTTFANKGFTPIEVEKDADKIVVASAEDKDAIQWSMIVNGANTTFQDAEGKYLAHKGTGTDLQLADAAENWTFDSENGCYSAVEGRAFFYYSTNDIFKNYSISNNLGKTGYSGAPEVIEIDPENIVVVVPTTHTLSYNPNGGTLIEGEDAIADAQVAEGAKVTVAANVYEKEGYVFAGWKYDEETTYNPGQKFDMPNTDVELVAQWATITTDNVVILAKCQGQWYAIKGEAGTSNHTVAAVPVVYDNNTIYLVESKRASITWERKAAGAQASFKNGTNYLQGKPSDSNDLDLGADECWWTYNSTDAIYQTHADHSLLYSSQVGLFKNYKTSNKSADGETGTYSALPIVVPAVFGEPTYETVRQDLAPNKYYTMCLEKAVDAVRGASIWRVLSKAENGTDIILEEVIGTLDAGRPYIFCATADKLEVVYSGSAVTEEVNDEANNGLVGSFEQKLIEQSQDNFILYDNALYYVNTAKVYVGEHRAYLYMPDVPAYNGNAQAPGRRRVTMHTNAPQVATGMDELNASETPVKMIIDGKMYILRGEKMYDATGRLVK